MRRSLDGGVQAMQLMIQRGQKSGLFRPIFNLWAKFELTPEEWALIHKYGTQRVVLKEGNAAFEFWLSTRISFVIAFITMVVINIRWGIVVSLELGVFVFVVGAFIIYHSIRTQIWVEDILNGQYFTCRSVAALIEKE